ncbi:MAG: HAD family hydrolase [Clostridiales bacterium]|nr:HAD family hydrolase [Clostridiales bacterium]
MKKAVIFDMDGVLVDSQPFHFEVDRITLCECGFPATPDEVKPYAGMATVDRFTKYKKDYAIPKDVSDIINICEKVRTGLLKTAQFEPIDGIPALLRSLKERKIKTAVASSSSDALIGLILDALGIRAYFDVLLSGENMPHSKPAPDIFLAAAEKLGCSPDESIVIEDSTNGVAAAKNANMRCVGFYNPNSGNQDISKADMIIDRFQTLLDDDAWLG